MALALGLAETASEDEILAAAAKLRDGAPEIGVGRHVECAGVHGEAACEGVDARQRQRPGAGLGEGDLAGAGNDRSTESA